MFQTPFVRQNTPHPRELKAKAHKLFARGQTSLEDSSEQQSHSESVAEAINTNLVESQAEPKQDQLKVIGNSWTGEENSEPSAEDDTDDVSF